MFAQDYRLGFVLSLLCCVTKTATIRAPYASCNKFVEREDVTNLSCFGAYFTPNSSNGSFVDQFR